MADKADNKYVGMLLDYLDKHKLNPQNVAEGYRQILGSEKPMETYMEGAKAVAGDFLTKLNEYVSDPQNFVGSMGLSGQILPVYHGSKNTSNFFKEMQDVAFQPGHPKEQLFHDLNNVLMNHPNDLSFNPNTGRIVGSVARDGAFAIKGDGGGYSVKKEDFIKWLHSDKPFDPKVYGENIKVDEEWIGSIERLREALPWKSSIKE